MGTRPRCFRSWTVGRGGDEWGAWEDGNDRSALDDKEPSTLVWDGGNGGGGSRCGKWGACRDGGDESMLEDKEPLRPDLRRGVGDRKFLSEATGKSINKVWWRYTMGGTMRNRCSAVQL